MTGQSLLDRMVDLNRELKLAAGDTGVTRGLRSLNVAQDHFETLIGAQPRVLGGQTGTVTTAANTETTTFPTGLLRLDKLQFIDPATSRPKHDIERMDGVGDHAPSYPWPVYISITAGGVGEPREYWTDGASFYWKPLPDATHTIRWYGFQRRSDITAAGTFAYDDGVAFPLAIFAVEIMRRGLDDPIGDYIALAQQVFGPTIRMLKRFRRERAPTRQYRYAHDT